MAVNLSLFAGAGWQFFTDNGIPLSGGLLYTYTAGSTTPETTYADNGGATQNANPIVLDAAGRPPSEIWLSANTDYKFVVKTSTGTLIRTYDNIPGANDSFLLDAFIVELANTSNIAQGDALVGFKQANASGIFAGAVSRTVHDKLTEFVSVLDFGAVGNGITDDTAAIQSAVNSLHTSGGGTLYFPTGTYLLNGKNTPINNNSRLVDGVFLYSNITIKGDGFGSVIKVATNCANAFVFGNYTADVTIATNINNVIIKDIQISRDAATFYEFNFQIFIQSAANVLIDNVYFNGWSGDAICIGSVNDPTLSTYYAAIADNIRICNCTFDGVDNNNRQAVSIFSGTNIEICNNYIKNTTRSNMPGAIDLEPDKTFHIITNISIHDNSFDNIGGSVGVISLALNNALTTPPANIYVYNNSILNSVNSFAFYCLGVQTATNVLSASAPYNIVFTNNNITQQNSAATRPFSVAGINTITFSNNVFTNTIQGSNIGNPATAGTFVPLLNFSFINNTFANCKVISTDFYTPMINVQGTLINSTISNNNFINCGRWSNATTPASMEVFGLISAVSLASTYLTIANNTVSSGGTAYATNIPVFFSSGALTYPTTITMVNNKFIGYTEYGDVYSLYTQVGNTAITNGSVSYQNLAANPSTPKKGDTYYNSTTDKLTCWNGATWNNLF